MFVFWIGFLGLCWATGFFLLWQIPICGKTVKKQDSPFVSVIIPARNEEERIGNLLRSLEHQSYSPMEVLVVDDESNDRTAKVAAD